MPRLPSLASFALAIACFFLPFVTVSCSALESPTLSERGASPSITISGMQLATGRVPATAMFPEIPEFTRQTQRFGRQSIDSKPEIFAIIPLIGAVVGLGTNFLNPVNLVIPAIAGATGAISLLLLKNKIDGEIAQYLALVQVRYEYGFWFALVCFVVAFFLNLYELFRKPRFR